MPRLGLRSTGRAVEESAKALADGLLLIEQSAGAAISGHFRRYAPGASDRIRRGDFPLDHLDGAISESTTSARATLERAGTMAVDTIQAELATLGDALSARKAARAGIAQAALRQDEAVEAGMLAFNVSIPGIRSQFASFLRTQTMRYRDHEDLQRRVFAERAVAGMGIGAWYRPPVWLLGQVRASMYALVNHIEIHGIDGFNRAL